MSVVFSEKQVWYDYTSYIYISLRHLTNPAVLICHRILLGTVSLTIDWKVFQLSYWLQLISVHEKFKYSTAAHIYKIFIHTAVYVKNSVA